MPICFVLSIQCEMIVTEIAQVTKYLLFVLLYKKFANPMLKSSLHLYVIFLP